MRPIIRTLAITAAVGTLTTFGMLPASAEPPVHTDDSGHTHHLTTGNGSCQQVGAVTWDADTRGLHRGANASGTSRGPWHGPCA